MWIQSQADLKSIEEALALIKTVEILEEQIRYLKNYRRFVAGIFEKT